MKKLEMLGAKMLTKDQMSCVKGGKLQSYVCQCSDQSAIWYGEYSSQSRANERASYWCGSKGGRCDQWSEN